MAATLGAAAACGGNRGEPQAAAAPASAALANAAPTTSAPAPAPAATNIAGLAPAFDFIANRAHAHLHVDGRLVIPGAGPEFWKFADGGWKTSWLAPAPEGARPAGLQGLLVLPVDADGDGVDRAAPTLSLTMDNRVPAQRLSLFVNQQAAGTVDVPTGVNVTRLRVPPALLRDGDNELRLQFRGAADAGGGKRSAATLRRADLGAELPDGAAGPASAADLVAEATAGGAKRKAFVVPARGRLSFYAHVPPGARLHLHVAATGGAATALVRMATDGAPPRSLAQLDAGAAWRESSIDLSAHAGRAVRLDFVARGAAVAFAEPRLMVRAPAAAPPRPRKLDRLYVWMVDTLRADKLRVYNPQSRVATPHFDAFAKESTRFAWAQVPGTWSLPSHAAVFTGAYPSVHGAISHESRVSPALPFLAEVLKRAGYKTAIFSSNGYVSGKWGFDRGWDHYRNFIRESLPNNAPYLWKTAKPWLEAAKTSPQFVYFATIEPHVAYTPKPESLKPYWDKPYNGPLVPIRTGLQLGQIKAGRLKINDDDKDYLRALYDAEVAEADAAFGKFLADLKAMGLYEGSAIVVFSDHGDEFWEHGDVGHAQSVHQELVHVPLMIRAPGFLPDGAVVEADVEAMDLFPTLLELAGLTPGPDVQGASLLELPYDPAAWPRAALSQNVGLARGVKAGRFRLVHRGLARMELYDDIADPTEQRNLVATHPIALRAARGPFALLVALENRWRKAAWGSAANLKEAFYGGNR